MGNAVCIKLTQGMARSFPASSDVKQVLVNINGTIYSEKEAAIPVFDHGFLYGDSVYETLRTFNGIPFLFDEHIERLSHSCQSIDIPLPWGEERFRAEMAELGRRLGAEDFIYRIIITRGVGPIGYKPCAAQRPTVVIICSSFKGFPEEAYTEGITIYTVGVRRNHETCLNPSVKSSNLLNLRLAYNEASRKGGDEALMLNLSGEVAECSSSTIFFVKDGEILTPSLDTGILPGITRSFVLSLACKKGLKAREARLPADIIRECDESFITSTIKSIIPVKRIDDHIIGMPGIITRSLMNAFTEAAERITATRNDAVVE